MSGGSFNYFQNRYEFLDAIDRIQSEIDTGEYDPETVTRLNEGIELIQKTQIYLQRIDYLFCSDDSEGSFHKRLNDELSKLSKK